MLRILFVIVAVVAAALALVIEQPLLFFGAGAAFGVALVMAIVHFARRRRRNQYRKAKQGKSKTPPDATSGVSAEEEEQGDERRKDLAAVGILDIRPKSAVNGSGDGEEMDSVSGNGSSARATNGSAKAPRLGAPVQAALDFSIQEYSQDVRLAVSESAHKSLREVLIPYMQAYRAIARANTVCLLRQPASAPRYHIEAIASLNRNARGSGSFISETPLLPREYPTAGLHVLRASKGQISKSTCGYYRQRVPINKVAVIPVPVPSSLAQYVLLADVMRGRILRSEEKQILSMHFAHLLGNILEMAIADELLREAKEDIRPRSEIIGEEISWARDQGTPLALALVYLNRAEEVADEGGQRAVLQAESLLVQRLRETVRGARVERFGELMFGVFFKDEGAAVEQWAVRFQQDMLGHSGFLGDGVSIGIAVLGEGNASAEAFRREATEALREAFDTGLATIVG